MKSIITFLIFPPCVILTGSVVMEKKNEMSIDYRQDDKNSRKKMTFTHMTKRDKDRLGKWRICKYIINKGNAKRGVSTRLKIWPGDLDLWSITLKINRVLECSQGCYAVKNLTRWSWKSIRFQIFLRNKYVPSLVKIH